MLSRLFPLRLFVQATVPQTCAAYIHSSSLHMIRHRGRLRVCGNGQARHVVDGTLRSDDAHGNELLSASVDARDVAWESMLRLDGVVAKEHPWLGALLLPWCSKEPRCGMLSWDMILTLISYLLESFGLLEDIEDANGLRLFLCLRSSAYVG